MKGNGNEGMLTMIVMKAKGAGDLDQGRPGPRIETTTGLGIDWSVLIRRSVLN